MSMLKVNGTAIPAPAGMKVTLFDVGADVSRNAAGNAVMDFCGEKRKLELNWAHMEEAALATLLESIAGFFEVEYPDPQSGGLRTMVCYCGERTSGILRMVNGSPLWTDVKMVWTER